MSERVAIVGSRDWPYPERVRAYVRTLPPGTVVISGGGGIVDKTAEDEARKCGLKVVVYPAEWEKHGKKAGFIRNSFIAENCTRCVAFWCGASRGTGDTIGKVRGLKKPFEIRTTDMEE